MENQIKYRWIIHHYGIFSEWTRQHNSLKLSFHKYALERMMLAWHWVRVITGPIEWECAITHRILIHSKLNETNCAENWIKHTKWWNGEIPPYSASAHDNAPDVWGEKDPCSMFTMQSRHLILIALYSLAARWNIVMGWRLDREEEGSLKSCSWILMMWRILKLFARSNCRHYSQIISCSPIRDFNVDGREATIARIEDVLYIAEWL